MQTDPKCNCNCHCEEWRKIPVKYCNALKETPEHENCNVCKIIIAAEEIALQEMEEETRREIEAGTFKPWWE